MERGVAQSHMHRRAWTPTSELVHGPPRVREHELAIANELRQETR
jgi:hypothetical protein